MSLDEHINFREDQSITHKECGAPMICVEYDWKSPEHYDGTSEYWCPACNIRIGRWTGKILDDEELEPRYGKLRD